MSSSEEGRCQYLSGHMTYDCYCMSHRSPSQKTGLCLTDARIGVSLDSTSRGQLHERHKSQYSETPLANRDALMTFPYWSLCCSSRKEPRFDFSRATATIEMSVKWGCDRTTPRGSVTYWAVLHSWRPAGPLWCVDCAWPSPLTFLNTGFCCQTCWTGVSRRI